MIGVMEKDWRNRIKELVEADGRSLRSISEAAGLGPNYLSQMLAGKDPTVENLTALLEKLAPKKILYVITGADLTPEDVQMLRLINTAPDHLRGAILQILAGIEAGQ